MRSNPDNAISEFIDVSECEVVDDALVEAMRSLIGQLSSSCSPPSREDLEEIVASPATTLLLAISQDESVGGLNIVGALTLVVYRIPTGVRSRIEDLVVDETWRGQRIGEYLSDVALDRARALRAISVDLTSRPSRHAANRLYRRMGFMQRDSNVYRFNLRTQNSMQ